MLEPSYLRMNRAQLNRRIEQAWELMRSPCHVCPRGCKVDRTKDDHRGHCGVGARALVGGAFILGDSFTPLDRILQTPHGDPRSGQLAFSSCNMGCVFCSGYRFSNERQGAELSSEQLAQMMLNLQEAGAINIHLFTPSMYGPQILAALPYAIDGGLRLPLLYGTSCYDSVEMLRLLDGIVDVYAATLKYSDDAAGARYSGVSDYWTVAKAALREMHRQVGNGRVRRGAPARGLFIKHLVLPNDIAGTAKAMRFIAGESSPHSCVLLNDDYAPVYRAGDYPEVARRTSGPEFIKAVMAARGAGLRRLLGARDQVAWIMDNPDDLRDDLPTALDEYESETTIVLFQRGLSKVLGEDAVSAGKALGRLLPDV